MSGSLLITMVTQNTADYSRTITIVGGSGAMGQLFSKYLAKTSTTVKILGRSNWDDANTFLAMSDLVIVCVPIKNTYETIDKVCQYISPTTILADFTSIKDTIISYMQGKHIGPVLGLHPMFGPTITSPQSQVIINCGGQQIEKSLWFIQMLNDIGFTVHNMSSREHDLIMSFVQGIEHFSTFALGTFLRSQNIHPEKLLDMASPIYQAKLALLGRIFDQDAELYADIIMSDSDRIKLIDTYISHMQAWLDKLKTQKRKEFIAEFDNTSEWMGDFTQRSQLASDHFLTEVTNSFKK